MNYTVKLTRWDKDQENLSQVRRSVFIGEQQVPEELEWDEFDNISIHVLVTDKNNQTIATGRMKPDGHIGRMAVSKNYRKTGIGSAILKALIKEAINRHLNSVYLHAQTTAIPFYEKHGFKISSEEFMDAGIPHKSMTLDL